MWPENCSLRFLNIAEASTFDLDVRISLACCFNDFVADVLPFSITIGPNDEVAGVPCLISKIFCYGLFVLGSVRVSIIGAGYYLDAPIETLHYEQK